MASTITENDNLAFGEFTPFNDTNGPQITEAVKVFVNTSQGYNTTDIDRFRQGVSITQQKHVYGSSQPKIWSGNIKHKTVVRTIGQARSFVEYDDSIAFLEKPEFNPVWYIDDDDYSYPFPIIFNNGPQQEEEAIIEPFTIPMRKNDNYGPFYPRGVKGTLEDGNSFGSLDGAASRVEQFIDYNPPLDPNYFLDEGQEYFGDYYFGPLLDETFDPNMLYKLDGGPPYTDTVNPDDGALSITGDVTVQPGPYPNTINNPTTVGFGPTLGSRLTHFDTEEKLLPGVGTHKFTAEAFINPTGSAAGLDIFINYGNPVNFQMGINHGFSPPRMQYSHNGYTATFPLSASQLQYDNWNHAAIVREVDADAGTTTVHGYLNGVYVGTDTDSSVPPTPTVFFIQISYISTNYWDGKLSSVKFIRRALTEDEIFSEYLRLRPVYKTDGAVRIEGYTPVIIRNISPFNDTRDEVIVQRLQTSDQEFISAVKALDVDLSEDIRGSFYQKSATAGNIVYGPDASIYGTDSIAFAGNMRGA